MVMVIFVLTLDISSVFMYCFNDERVVGYCEFTLTKYFSKKRHKSILEAYCVLFSNLSQLGKNFKPETKLRMHLNIM